MADGFLPPVVATLKANITDFAKGMQKARQDMEGTSKGGMTSFQKLALGMGGSMAAAGGAAVAFAKKSLGTFESVAGEVAKMQRVTGGTAEQMSQLRFAAEETGVSTDTLSRALLKFSKSAMASQDSQGKQFDSMVKANNKLKEQVAELEKVQKPTKAQADKLTKLRYALNESNKALQESTLGTSAFGVAMVDAEGNARPMTDILADVADKFKDMPNGMEKNALAIKLFGKSGADLIPLLNKGKDGVNELMKEADKFGVVIGQKDVDAMKANKLAHRQMHAAWEGLQIQIGRHLMPVIAKLSTQFAKHLPEAIAVVKKVIKFLEPAFEAVGKIIAWLQKWIEDHWAQIRAAIQMAVEGVRKVLQWLVKWFRDHWAQIKMIVTEAVNMVRAVIEGVVKVIQGIWQRFGSNIMDVIKHAWAAIQTIVKAAIQIVRGIIEVVTNIIHGNWSKVWDGIKKIFSGVWDAIVGYLKYALDLVKNALSIAWKVVKEGVGKAWNGVKHLVVLAVTGIIDFIKNLPGKLLEWIGDLGSAALKIGKSIVDGIAKGLKAVVDVITAPFKDAWNAIADLWNNDGPGGWGFTIPSWVPVLSGDSFTVPNLPKLANGGTILESGLAMVGERGPEIVSLPTGATVYPTGTGPKGGVQQHFTFHVNGITDVPKLARHTSSEMAWALKTQAV